MGTTTERDVQSIRVEEYRCPASRWGNVHQLAIPMIGRCYATNDPGDAVCGYCGNTRRHLRGLIAEAERLRAADAALPGL